MTGTSVQATGDAGEAGSPAADDRWRWVRSQPYRLLIDGTLRDGADGATSQVISPRNLQAVAEAPIAGPTDVDDAVAAARRAYDGRAWGRSSARDRALALRRIGDLIETHKDELAFLDALDSGRPIGSVYFRDIAGSIDALSFFGGQARSRTAKVAVMPDEVVIHHELLEPMGVVAEIVPWNGPLLTGVQRLAAILAAGNVAIMKPSQTSALSFLRLAELLTEADLPPGVVTVLAGPGASVGEQLVAHPGVDMVSLTGGLETGPRILALAAPTLKRVSLELGGKNPDLVFGDADLDAAVRWTALGSFRNAGEICVCASRIYVERSVYSTFVDRLVQAAHDLKVGDPLSKDTDVGPVVSMVHAEKVWAAIESGRQVATLATGGIRYDDSERSIATFVPPTIFVDVPPSCDIAREEIFGPVVVVIPFDSDDEAIRLANDTHYGLASGVFTRDLDRAWNTIRRLKAGQVYVNQWFATGAMLEAASHGYKRSGYGGVGLQKYQQSKNAFFRVADTSSRAQ